MSAVLAEPDGHGAAHVAQLWLANFRCFSDANVTLPPGLTVVDGNNGQGKTSLLEAVGWVARARSFRGVPDAQLVRRDAESAIVRAEVVHDARTQLFEAEIRVAGRNRILCNKQTVTRTRDLHGLLRVTVFAPDDLALVKDGPSERRTYLDELLVMLAARYDAARADYERVLKQRNALLRRGLRDEHAGATREVFDEQLVTAGSELVRGRLRLIERLLPAVTGAYASVAGPEAAEVSARYEADWGEDGAPEVHPDAVDVLLRDALARRRSAEIERGVTLVGPHRDEWHLELGGLDARTQASQGEQRSLALALRLAGHAVVTELVGAAPVLLLDDVFSELDAARATALVRNLPKGQTLITTAGHLPEDVIPDVTVHVERGVIRT